VLEDDLPDATLFLQEGRLQPFLVRCTGAVADAAFVNVGDPSGVAADVDVRFLAPEFYPVGIKNQLRCLCLQPGTSDDRRSPSFV
jgi:hypothetical protein